MYKSSDPEIRGLAEDHLKSVSKKERARQMVEPAGQLDGSDIMEENGYLILTGHGENGLNPAVEEGDPADIKVR